MKSTFNGNDAASADQNIEIRSKGVLLKGDLSLPEEARGLVIFAHGAGSSRHSPRNRAVARFLNQQGLGTFLLDLLSPEEESLDYFTGHVRFDLPLLAERLLAATEWVEGRDDLRRMPRGYFGSSTGAGAALMAAAKAGDRIQAVVSRGGRPDLADEYLPEVGAPTLLIVGGRDIQVIGMNRQAASKLRCEFDLVIIPEAGHLFEEAGALEKVAQLAADWFLAHLQPPVRT